METEGQVVLEGCINWQVGLHLALHNNDHNNNLQNPAMSIFHCAL